MHPRVKPPPISGFIIEIAMNPAVVHENAPVADDRLRAEFGALISGCGVYDLNSRGRIAVTGSDRVRWLNGMVTNNIRDLPTGRGVYAFLLNPQGRILGDMHAYNLGESLAVETDTAQLPKILETFDRYIIMDDVKVADISGSASAIGIAGPKTRSILNTAGFVLPPLQPLQLSTGQWQAKEVSVIRGDNPKIETYELWLSSENAKALLGVLTKAGATHISSDALEWLRIASGIPRYGTDIREKDLPQETKQERALNFSKGCYIGQEIVERIRSRGAVHRQFTGFAIDGLLLEPGAELHLEGKKVGEITSVASLPLIASVRNIGLGYIRREVAVGSKPLDGVHFQATPVSLPFDDFFKN